jgi:hypothetical protein
MSKSFRLAAILSAVDRISPVLEGVQGATKKTRKYLSDMASAAGRVASSVGLPLSALSGVLGGGLIFGVQSLVKNFASASAELDATARRVGVTAEELQYLQYQAEMTQVPFENMQDAVAELNKRIGEAVSGKNQDLAALFAKLHVNLRDANGQVRDGVDLLPELAEAFKRNTSAVTRARIGDALFSDGYKAMLPLLDKGAEGLAKLREEHSRVARVISNEQVAAAARLNQSFVRARYAVDGIGAAVAQKLLPVVEPLIDRFVDWAAANRDVLATRLAGYAERLGAAFARIDLIALLDGIAGFIEKARSFVSAIGGMNTVMVGFGIMMLAGPVASVFQLLSAMKRFGGYVGGDGKKAFDFLAPRVKTLASVFSGTLLSALSRVHLALHTLFAFLAANPILLAVAGIATAAFLVIKHWDTVKAWFTEFFDWIGEKWQAFSGWIDGVASAVGGFFGGGGGPVQAPAQQSSLVTAGSQRVGGSIAVNFNNAPAGMRVANTQATPGFDLNASVGYRGFALDGP